MNNLLWFCIIFNFIPFQVTLSHGLDCPPGVDMRCDWGVRGRRGAKYLPSPPHCCPFVCILGPCDAHIWPLGMISRSVSITPLFLGGGFVSCVSVSCMRQGQQQWPGEHNLSPRKLKRQHGRQQLWCLLSLSDLLWLKMEYASEEIHVIFLVLDPYIAAVRGGQYPFYLTGHSTYHTRLEETIFGKKTFGSFLQYI